jgi:hypothetical protein
LCFVHITFHFLTIYLSGFLLTESLENFYQFKKNLTPIIMKKVLLAFTFMILLSAIAFSQTENKDYNILKSKLDFLIKEYRIQEFRAYIAGEVEISKKYSIEDGYLVMNDEAYFRMDKLAMFKVSKLPYRTKYTLTFVFN